MIIALGVSLARAGTVALALLLVAATTAASTKVVKYSANTINAKKVVKGSCWTSSIASPRSDAFRCMVDNEIYDPCFKIDPKSVGCPTDIAADRGVVIDLTKPLPPPESPQPTPQAWAMVLQTGALCNRGTGTIVADFPFYCAGETGVCKAPDLSVAKTAYFVKCGKPVDAMHVQNVTSTLVTIVYE